MKAERSSNSGFPCPKCDGRTGVRDSRQVFDGIRRRRRCLTCEYRFTTWESWDMKPNKDEFAQTRMAVAILPRLFKLADLIDEIRAEHEP